MLTRFTTIMSILQQNISVDMIPVDGDFSKYKVIAAPVLYMVKEGMKEKLEQFVKTAVLSSQHL